MGILKGFGRLLVSFDGWIFLWTQLYQLYCVIFSGLLTLAILELHFNLLYFVWFIHDDRCCSFVRFFEVYGRVFKATITLRDNLFLGLSILMSASCVLTRIAFKGHGLLNWRNPVWFDMKRMWFYILAVKYVLEAHSSRKLFKILQELSPNYGFVSHGRWDKFKTPW